MKIFIVLSVLATAALANVVLTTSVPLQQQQQQVGRGAVQQSNLDDRQYLRLVQNNKIDLENRLLNLDQSRRLNDAEINELRRIENLRNNERIYLNDDINRIRIYNNLRNIDNENIINAQSFESQRLNDNTRRLNDDRLIRNNDLRTDVINLRRNEQLRIDGQLNKNLQGIQDTNGASPLLTRTRLAQSLGNIGQQGVSTATSSNLRLNNKNNYLLRDVYRTNDLNNQNLRLNNNERILLNFNDDGQQLYQEQLYY